MAETVAFAPGKDAFDEQAEKLLPAVQERAWRIDDAGLYINEYAARYRPSVAAVLRAQASALAEAKAEIERRRGIMDVTEETLRDASMRLTVQAERIAKLEAFVGTVSRFGILDHDKDGTLDCPSCRIDAATLRLELAALASPSEPAGGRKK